MKSTPKKQSTHDAASRPKVEVKDLKPKKDPRGGINRTLVTLDTVIDVLDRP